MDYESIYNNMNKKFWKIIGIVPWAAFAIIIRILTNSPKTDGYFALLIALLVFQILGAVISAIKNDE